MEQPQFCVSLLYPYADGGRRSFRRGYGTFLASWTAAREELLLRHFNGTMLARLLHTIDNEDYNLRSYLPEPGVAGAGPFAAKLLCHFSAGKLSELQGYPDPAKLKQTYQKVVELFK